MHVNLPPMSANPTFRKLQEWEGHVIEIGADEFVARLVDRTPGHSHETEEASIPLAELSDSDTAKIAVGSIFRWVIGYEDSPSGVRRRVSQIAFRDLPRMTGADFSEGRE